jgi:glycosyltransferase involved in cell wall biosynthesis
MASNARPAPIFVFFPAHDEEATVGDVVARTPASVGGHPVVTAVVDDGSTDGTATAAAAAGAELISFERNAGLGAAVRAGLAAGARRGAAAVVFMDADGEYAPEELHRMVAPILEGEADYVVGSRFAGGPRHMRPHRWAGNRLLTLAVRALVRRHGVRGLTDGQSGYRALSPAAAASAEVIHDFNYAQVLTLDLVAKGFVYAEVPISYAFRLHGRSFVRLGRYLRAVIPAVLAELRSDPRCEADGAPRAARAA